MAQQSNLQLIKPNPKIKPGKEYVTGASWFTDQPRALPSLDESLFNRDAISHETVTEMLHDPEVFAGIMLIALMAMNERLLITPAIDIEVDYPTDLAGDDTQNAATPAKSQPATADDTTQDNVPADGTANATQPSPKPVDKRALLASEIAEFCQRQMDRVPKMQSKLFQLVFEGLAHGNKVAENVLEVPTGGVDAGKWALKDVKPKPRECLAFVVDPYMNELGFLAAQPGQMTAVQTTMVVDDKEIIPREKFTVFTYRPKDNDPRGQTICDAARNGWDLKRRTWPEYLLFLMVSAIPGILATLPPGADEIALFEDDGTTPIIDQVTGEQKKISGYQYLLQMLAKMRNHQVGVAPEGTTFTTLEANSDGEVFTKALHTFGTEITQAILLQELATKDAEHQTKGATSSQARVVDLLVFWVRDTAADMVRYDIFKPLVRYNFGDEAADELLPKCSYGDTESRDWATDASAASSLEPKLTESQWDFVTTQLGIPAPTDAERVARRQLKQLMATALQSAGSGSASGADQHNNADGGQTNSDKGKDAQ